MADACQLLGGHRCPSLHPVPPGRWRCHGTVDFQCRGRWAFGHCRHWPEFCVVECWDGLVRHG